VRDEIFGRELGALLGGGDLTEQVGMNCGVVRSLIQSGQKQQNSRNETFISHRLQLSRLFSRASS
jgi:hypothetical protein